MRVAEFDPHRVTTLKELGRREGTNFRGTIVCDSQEMLFEVVDMKVLLDRAFLLIFSPHRQDFVCDNLKHSKRDWLLQREVFRLFPSRATEVVVRSDDIGRPTEAQAAGIIPTIPTSCK